MLTPEQTDGLQDAFQRLTEPLTDYLVKDIARRVSQAGQLTSTAAYQIWKLQKLGRSRDEVERQVGELLGKELEEVQTLFRQAAEVGYNFDISRLPRDALAFADNAIAQQIVEAAVKLAQEDLTNLTQTIGFVGEDGVVRELTSAYRHATDTAFTQVVSGGVDYNTALRKACAQLVRQGIRTIDYESGVHTSLEAAVRRNLMGGLGLMVEEISQENHDALGADGWEISAHAMSAPDHEPFQGKQYSDEDYARLNASLHRRIGTLNCGHNAFPILLGISQPQYTPQELEQFRSDNETGVTVDGRHYTGYEATQKQRQIERAIRTQKRRILVEEAGGDKDRLSAAQIRLQRLRQEYRRFSNAAGLRTEEERLVVSGFGEKQLEILRKNAIIKSEIRTAGNIAKQAKIHLTPKPINTDVLGFDDEHINRDRKHNVTKEQAVDWIRQARLSVTVWNGRYERYYAADGISYVDLENKIIRTAYSAEEFDEHIKNMMGVLKKHGIL